MAHVTILDVAQREYYTLGGASTGPFAFSFTYFDEDDIDVYKNGALLTKTTHYTVAGTAVGNYFQGGSISLVSAGALNDEIAIVLNPDIVRSTDFSTVGPLSIATLNTLLDQLFSFMRILDEKIERTFHLAPEDSGAGQELPDVATRANMLLGFNASGVPIASSGSGTIAISGAMTPVVQAATLAAGRAAFGFPAALESLWTAADFSAARLALNALGNERLAKSAAYPVVNADKGKTIACGTAPWTLTFNAPSGYDSDFWVLVVNESTSRGILCSISGGTNFWLYPGQTALVFNQNNVWRALRPERWRLTGATTIYVDGTNGNNSNDGLASGSGNAFLTWAQARTVLANDVDFNGQTVTVQIADGTYTATLSIPSTINFMGGGKLVLQGNTGTPANVVISTTGDHAVRVQGHKSVEVNITGMTLQTATAGSCVYAYAGGVVRIGSSVRIGAGAWGGLVASEGGQIWVDANIEILATASLPFAVNTKGYLNCVSKTVTYTGTPAWVPACARSIGGLMDFAGCTMSGGATGKRYDATENGVIRVGGGGANYFPGNVAGTTATGGQYN